jgi:AcrR family transcriptional regulator
MTPVTPPTESLERTTVPGMPATSSADDSRVAILDAANRLLADEGPSALTVRRIAAEAGGSTMNVYSRFGGKEGVLDALFREGFERLAATMRRGKQTTDSLADLRRCARTYRTFALENPTYYSVMFDRSAHDFRPTLDAHLVAATTLDMLAEKVQRAIDDGRLAGNAADIAADLWAANHGLVSLELQGIGPKHIDWSRRHAETIDALLVGFGGST